MGIGSMVKRISRKLPAAIAVCGAVYMLCLVPLLFRDAFFDINRVKVQAVCIAAPVFLLLRLIAVLLEDQSSKSFTREMAAPVMIALVFAASCVIACARAGFEAAVLTGSEGRYCGLWFLLSCIAMFLVISSGRIRSKCIIPLIALCAAACAALGVVNMMGYDPLGFYTRITPGQEREFLSTIGHFDFFGTFLTMIFPLCAAHYIRDERAGSRVFYGVASCVIALGAAASRTDSAFLGLNLVCFMLLALNGGSLVRLARVFILWAACFLAFQTVSWMVPHSLFSLWFTGLVGVACHSGAVLAAVVLCVAGAAVCRSAHARGKRAPDAKRVAGICFFLLLLAGLLLAAAIAYFTLVNPEAELGAAESLLRFNDKWGSLRGLVYTRSLRAYADYSLADKLFGRGLDLAYRIVNPYFEDPSALIYGVYTDVHCQPLQFLLTCGLLGMLSFLGFHLLMLRAVLLRAGEDTLLCGVFASLVGYFVVMAINVTQPILISTYFAVCALGLSGLRKTNEEGNV